MKHSTFWALVLFCAFGAQAADFNVMAFGAAEANSPKQNAESVQRAIDKASSSGGGRVVVPAGTFACGTLWLKPDVELHLDEGAVLMASSDMADYNAEDAYPENFGMPDEFWTGRHFIIAREAHRSSITGPGVVDGNGDAFYEERPVRHLAWMVPGADAWWNGIRWAKDKTVGRPGQLVVFVKSDGVSVRNLTIRHACCWSLYFWGCDGVRVSDYRVRNGENDGNTDGIDIDCSRDVEVVRADIDTGDDAIAIRAAARDGLLGRPDVTENVRIRDCRLRSSSAVIRMGVGAGTIRDVTIEDVTCDRGGTPIHFTCVCGDPAKSGVDIEGLTVRNARFANCARGLQFVVGGARQQFGLRNIVFEDCAFGKGATVRNVPGCRFPFDESAIVYRYSSAEHYADSEFRRYAGDFPVVFEKGDMRLGDEGFLLYERDGKLHIAGGRRGLLYGVYEALERFWGVRWCASDFTYVPDWKDVKIPVGFVFEDRPAFRLRNGYFYDAKESPDFAARLRFNGDFHDLDERHGGTCLRFGKGMAHHTLDRLLPAAKYGKEHPEYFCMRDGRRQMAENSMYKLQMCLTNPDVLRIVASNLLEEIAKDPTAERYSVSQNDNHNYCTCPACAAIDAEEGSHAGTLIRFVNAVAAEVEKRYPGKFVQTSAYQYSRKPPKTKPRHNVLIGLCPIECDCSQPLATGSSPKNAAFRQDLEGWLRLAGNVAIFNYVTQFSAYHMPFANLRALGADMRYYRDAGVKMITNEGLYNGHGADLEALRCYLAAKLMWNPDLDQDAVAEDFCRAYYGVAAAPVLAYYRKLKALSPRDGYSLDCCFSAYTHRDIVTDAFLNEAIGLWDEAEALARRESPATLTNVLKGAFAVRFTKFRRMNDMCASVPYSLRRCGVAAGDELSAEFRSMAEWLRDAYSVVWPRIRYWEERDSEKRAAEIKAQVLRAAAAEPVAGAASFRVDSSQLQVCMVGRDVDFVADAEAVGGRALKFRNEGWNWNAQLPLPASVFDKGESYRLRLRVKVAKTPGGKDNSAVEAGFFDTALRKEFGSRRKLASELEDGVWQWVDFGTFEPRDAQYLWIMAGQFDRKKYVRNPAVEAMYLDQVEISRARLD